MRTTLQPEEYAYPAGGLTRRGRAIVRPNQYAPGKTIRGYLSLDEDGEYTFTPDRNTVCPRA